MQRYLFFGGNQDSLSIPLADESEMVELPAGVTGKDDYRRDTLSIGDVSITIYLHCILKSQEVVNRLVEFYKAWAVNQSGGW